MSATGSAAAAPTGIVTARSDQGVALWLFVIAALIAAMVVVGGLTRLTGSGLSITEWRPVTGIIPPLSAADWQAEFAKYQGTTQYELINRGMGVADFKTIYWWEWGHRFLGRFMGFVFLIPFVYFVAGKRIHRSLAAHLAVIFLLGAAQGLLGWWMVQSGLAGRVSVSQYRLAAHLGLAVILFGYVLWTAMQVLGLTRTNQAKLARYRLWAMAFAGLVFLQILLGALVAGLDAGLAFSTWPGFAGRWIPLGLYDLVPWWSNHFENHAMAHLQHRNVGYLAVAMALWLYAGLRRSGIDRPVKIAAVHVAALTAVQAGLGVFTVITMVALPLAALHQLFALALFGAGLWLTYVLSPNRN